MQAIQPPVNPNSLQATIANLQDALLLLLQKGAYQLGDADHQAFVERLRPERDAQKYDDITRKLVALFQQQRNIQPTSEVDDPTANAINAFLREFGVLDGQGGWTEGVKALDVQGRTLSAINLGTDHLSSIDQKIGTLGKAAPLALNMRGDAVKDLHAQLGSVGVALPVSETTDGIFGVGTRDALLLYGAFRAGLPDDPEALALVSTEAFATALTRAKDAGVIGLDDAQMVAANTAFITFKLDTLRKAVVPGVLSSIGDMLEKARVEPTHKVTFEKLALLHDGDDAALWTEAKAQGIPPEQIASLQLQGKLAYLTLNNAPLTEALQDEIDSQDNMAQLVEKNLYRKDEWATRLKALASDNDQIPARLEVADQVNDQPAMAKKDTLAKDTVLGNLLVGNLSKIALPTPTTLMDKPFRLFFTDKAMSDLWIAVTWGRV